MLDKLFSKSGGARRGIAEIAIVITDGLSQKPLITKYMAEKAHTRGIYTFAIGVGGEVDRKELEAIASKPAKDYVYSVSSYAALDTVKNLLAYNTCKGTKIPAIPDIPIPAPQTSDKVNITESTIPVCPDLSAQPYANLYVSVFDTIITTADVYSLLRKRNTHKVYIAYCENASHRRGIQLIAKAHHTECVYSLLQKRITQKGYTTYCESASHRKGIQLIAKAHHTEGVYSLLRKRITQKRYTAYCESASH
ncbi:hypothetical protein CHS0354_022635 [Potamilus streckersoni]|uniref:VWFA domain-containing protein n=1 Tax=Potamilus streckersoni TaxID=2493646 RepID=A0AAE0THJ6_9BIVA|nr:hypothetical protein CHS0354_022635 [Potamilus streckersoni]